MKIVFDTNVLISAFAFEGGIPADLLIFVMEKHFQLGLSKDILLEFEHVLRKKFLWSIPEIKEAKRLVLEISTVVEPRKKLNIIKDKMDNRILECAAEFTADFIISVDKHLLDLKQYKSIKILSVRNFFNHLSERYKRHSGEIDA